MARQPDESQLESGRVHLQVADLDRALAFYQDVLRFDVALRLGDSQVFLTGNGRRHHIVLHADDAAGASPAGASQFSLRCPDRGVLTNCIQRLTDAGVPFDALDLGIAEALSFADPDGHRIELYCDRRPAEYRRTPSGVIETDPRPLDLEALRAAVSAGAAPGWGGADSAGADASRSLSDVTRGRLRELRLRLLTLHKVLLDDARAAYEMDRGQVRSNVNLLQLVISDPWFAWLHPLSELVVRIDEVLQPDAPATEADSAMLLDQVARLLTPGEENGRFIERYYEALQRQPAVVLAHAEVRRILKESR